MILVPVLFAAGILMKKSRVKDYNIPFLLGLIGIVLSITWAFSISHVFTLQSVLTQIFTGTTQGILVAAASVYFDQLVKQSIEAQACKKCEQLKRRECFKTDDDEKDN